MSTFAIAQETRFQVSKLLVLSIVLTLDSAHKALDCRGCVDSMKLVVHMSELSCRLEWNW